MKFWETTASSSILGRGKLCVYVTVNIALHILIVYIGMCSVDITCHIGEILVGS